VAGALLSATSVTGAILGLAMGSQTIELWGLPTTVTILGVGAVVAIPLILMLPETKGSVLVQDRASAMPAQATPQVLD
jgi:hypothetical protein